ncbi:MAG: hypothetical protein WBG73_04470 [Coleofasciculaceae cyanobacterium]
MKTSNKNQTASQQNQKRVQPIQLDKPIAKSRKWLKFTEFVVVGFATWLNPSAGLLIFLLKICFQILQMLQDDRKP